MEIIKAKNNISDLSLFLLGFVLLFNNTVAGFICAFLLVLNLDKYSIGKTKNKWFFYLPVLLFLLIAVSFFSNYNESTNFNQLLKRLPLIACPILIHLKKKDNIIKGISLSLFVYLLVCLIIAINNSIILENGELIFKYQVGEKAYRLGYGFLKSILQGGNYFYGSDFLLSESPIYISLFLNCTLAYLLFYKIKHKTWQISAIILSFLFIFLSGSRLGIFSGMVLILILTVRIFIISNNLFLRTGIIGLLIVLLSLLAMSPRTKYFITNVWNENYKLENRNESVALRLVAWSTSIENLSNYWLKGVGIGNEDSERKKLYNNKDYTIAAQKNLNFHNQFLDILFSLGITGLLLYISILIYPMISNFSFYSFANFSILSIYGLAESYLSRNYGVFILTILFSLSINIRNENINSLRS